MWKRSLVLLILFSSLSAPGMNRIARRCAIATGVLGMMGVLGWLATDSSDDDLTQFPTLDLRGENHSEIQYRRPIYQSVFEGKSRLLAEDYLTGMDGRHSVDLLVTVAQWGLKPTEQAKIEGIEDPFRFLSVLSLAMSQELRRAVNAGTPNEEVQFGFKLVAAKLWENPTFLTLWDQMMQRNHPFVKMQSELERVSRAQPTTQEKAKVFLKMVQSLGREVKPHQKLVKRAVAQNIPLQNLSAEMANIFTPLFRSTEEMIYLHLMLGELNAGYLEMAKSRNITVPTTIEDQIRWRSIGFAEAIYKSWRSGGPKGLPIVVFMGDDHLKDVAEELVRLGIPRDKIRTKSEIKF